MVRSLGGASVRTGKWAGRTRLTVLIGLALLASPAAAQADAVEDVEITTFQCTPTCQPAPAVAGHSIRVLVAFDVTSGLQPLDEITLELSANGFSWGQFREPGETSDEHYWLNTPIGNYNMSPSFSMNQPVFSPDGRQVVLTVPGVTVEAGQRVTVQAGYAWPLVMMPTTAGTYTLSVSTSRDTDPVAEEFEVEPGPPAAIHKENDNLSAVRGRAFAEPPQVRVEDANHNPIADVDVTFTAPSTETSGFFPGDVRTLVTSTDADGIATATGLTASPGLGDWQLSASAASGVHTIFSDPIQLTNLRPPPETLELVLDPEEVVANGVQTAKAVVTLINDEQGPAPGEEVTVSIGGEPAQAATDLGDGTYELEIPARTQPGPVEVTASYDGVEPPLTDTKELFFHADVGVPGVRITKAPKRRIARPKAAFRFRSSAVDLAGFECKLDRRAWRSCKSPKKYRVKRGKHTFRVRALDLAGNRSKPAVKKFKRVKKRR